MTGVECGSTVEYSQENFGEEEFNSEKAKEMTEIEEDAT